VAAAGSDLVFGFHWYEVFISNAFGWVVTPLLGGTSLSLRRAWLGNLVAPSLMSARFSCIWRIAFIENSCVKRLVNRSRTLESQDTMGRARSSSFNRRMRTRMSGGVVRGAAMTIPARFRPVLRLIAILSRRYRSRLNSNSGNWEQCIHLLFIIRKQRIHHPRKGEKNHNRKASMYSIRICGKPTWHILRNHYDD